MKKVLFFIAIMYIQIYSQSKFAVEADGGIDLTSTMFATSNYENGYSVSISSIYQINKTFSLMGTLGFHRAEGGISGGNMPASSGYSIDNTDKPNIYAYEIGLGLRSNFSDKIVKPYFVIKTGFLFTNVSYLTYSYIGGNGGQIYQAGWDQKHRIALYISPGFGLNFNLLSNLSFLVEARFNMTTGSDYSFMPVTTGFQFKL